jgi:hypothetical protein
MSGLWRRRSTRRGDEALVSMSGETACDNTNEQGTNVKWADMYNSCTGFLSYASMEGMRSITNQNLFRFIQIIVL